jgi:hypothetical protein
LAEVGVGVDHRKRVQQEQEEVGGSEEGKKKGRKEGRKDGRKEGRKRWI